MVRYVAAGRVNCTLAPRRDKVTRQTLRGDPLAWQENRHPCWTSATPSTQCGLADDRPASSPMRSDASARVSGGDGGWGKGRAAPVAIRAVVFDIGGVLENTPRTGWAGRWEAQLDRRRRGVPGGRRATPVAGRSP